MHVNGYQRVDVPSLFHSSVPRGSHHRPCPTMATDLAPHLTSPSMQSTGSTEDSTVIMVMVIILVETVTETMADLTMVGINFTQT